MKTRLRRDRLSAPCLMAACSLFLVADTGRPMAMALAQQVATRPATHPSTGRSTVGPAAVLTTRAALPMQPAPATRPGISKLPVPDALSKRLGLAIGREAWQALPAAIGDVYVGPDDRPWHVMASRRYDRVTLDAVSRQIEREFNYPAPQLTWLRPALFEPGGRIWFTYTGSLSGDLSAGSLIGFDGRTWVYRRGRSEHGYNGACPGHGGRADEATNLFVDGVALFVSRGEIDAFDGQDWTTRDFRVGGGGVSDGRARDDAAPPRLVAEPDGKGAIAIVRSGAQPKTSDGLYRFRDKRWSTLGGGPEGLVVLGVAPSVGGAWVATNYGLLWETYDAEPVEAVVARLDHADFRVRDAAVNALLARGPMAADDVRRATEGLAATPESRVRLKQVADALVQKLANLVGAPSRFGPFDVSDVRFAHPDGRGGTILGALQVTRGGKPLAPPDVVVPVPADDGPRRPRARRDGSGAGVLLADRDGTFHVLATGPEAVARWENFTDVRMTMRPLILPSEKQLWTGGNGIAVPATLIDVPSGRLVARLPSAEYNQPLATHRDGTLYVTGGGGGRVMRFDPNVPAARERILANHVIHSGAFCIADDGAAWAYERRRGMVRFDGTAWQPDARLAAIPPPLSLIPGRNGTMLVESHNSYALITRDRVVVENLLDDLVAAKAQAFGDGFAGPRRVGLQTRTLWVQADAAGNVWTKRRHGQELRVFAGGKWRDTNGALQVKGAWRPEAAFIAFAGAGPRVYVNDTSDGNDQVSGRAFLAEVGADGTFRFTEAPHTEVRQLTHVAIHDSAGRLWVFGYAPGGNKHPPVGTEASGAYRIGQNGVDAEIPGALPLRVDDDGNLWFRARDPKSPPKAPAPFRSPSDLIKVWRDGKTYDLPALGPLGRQAHVFPAGKGRVFVWTDMGLQLFTADPAVPAKFTAGPLYAIDGMDGRPQRVEYSPLGFVAVSTYGSMKGAGDLHILPMPRP